VSKRFTDTGKFTKGWIKALPVEMKLFWCYICDDCSHAGIWQEEVDVANIRLGTSLSKAQILEAFGGKIQVIEGGSKWFIPAFVEFQYGTLNPDNRAHNSVIQQLERHNLLKPLASPLEGPSEGAPVAPMDKDKDKDMVQEGGVGEKTVNLTKYPAPLQTEKFHAAWMGWLTHLKQKRKTPTEKAKEMQLAKCAEMGEARALAMIKHSIEGSYQGLYEDTKNGNTNNHTSRDVDRNKGTWNEGKADQYAHVGIAT